MTFFITNATAIAMCDVAVDRVDLGSTNPQGTLNIYAGTIPADADAALGGATELTDQAMSNPAFGNAVDDDPGAIATANAIADETSPTAGTATFFRIVNRDDVTVHQGGVGTIGSGEELELNTVIIPIDIDVVISSLTITQPES